jgi:hypothetical protein
VPCLPGPAALDEAWARIAAARYPSGAVPEEEELRGAEGADGEPEFSWSYHSTLMAAFAAVLTLGRLGGGARVTAAVEGARA